MAILGDTTKSIFAHSEVLVLEKMLRTSLEHVSPILIGLTLSLVAFVPPGPIDSPLVDE